MSPYSNYTGPTIIRISDEFPFSWPPKNHKETKAIGDWTSSISRSFLSQFNRHLRAAQILAIDSVRTEMVNHIVENDTSSVYVPPESDLPLVVMGDTDENLVGPRTRVLDTCDKTKTHDHSTESRTDGGTIGSKSEILDQGKRSERIDIGQETGRWSKQEVKTIRRIRTEGRRMKRSRRAALRVEEQSTIRGSDGTRTTSIQVTPVGSRVTIKID